MSRWTWHRPAVCLPLAFIVASTMAPVSAAVFDPGFPRESLNAPLDAVRLSPGAAIARTELISGTQSIVLPFFVSPDMPGGTVSVTLTDLGWPGLMSSLSFAASTSTSLLAQLAASGTTSFEVSGAGTYFATVYGVADPQFGSGLYSLNLSYSPVPLPAAALLLASGLALLARRRAA